MKRIVRGWLAWREHTDTRHFARRLLRLAGERRKNEAESDNDREPDPPHGHLDEMAGGSLTDLLTSPHGAGFRVTAMRVSEVLKRSGVTRKALRVYEARGIVSPARRTTSGYRIYADDVLGLLAFVQQGQRLGLSLAEIHRIINLRHSGRRLVPTSDSSWSEGHV